jgi:hypothetical protein
MCFEKSIIRFIKSMMDFIKPIMYFVNHNNGFPKKFPVISLSRKIDVGQIINVSWKVGQKDERNLKARNM